MVIKRTKSSSSETDDISNAEKKEITELVDAQNKNVSVTTVEESQNIDSKNKDLAKRAHLFPMLAEGVVKLGRKYPDDPRKAQESEWLNFKSKTDFSIPVKRIVTNIFRIRTMSNKEQALGEYVYYMANLIGSQKQYVNNNLQEFPSAEASDVPFGMDIQKVLQPSFKGGQLAGYEDKGEFRFYSEKFTPESINTILDNSDNQEGVATKFTILDTGTTYSNFTKEEFTTCKFNRLVYRSSNKLNGTEIKDEDKLK